MKRSILLLFVGALLGAGCVQQSSVTSNAEMPAPAPLAEAPRAPAPEVKAPPPVAAEPQQPKIEIAQSGQVWIVTADGKQIAQLPVGNGEDPEARVVGQTSTHAYVATCPGGLGGAYVYEACPLGLIEVALATGQTKDLSLRGGVFQDLSASGMVVAWKDDGKKRIVVKNLADGSEKLTIDLRQATEFGNARFSPDGKKIAYAAFFGDSRTFFGIEGGGAYSSQVVVVDLASGGRTVVVDKKNVAFSVAGWKDASTVDYREQ